MGESHRSRVRTEFEKQAGSFDDARHTIGSHEIMDWIVETIRPAADETVLDVAAGTALLGRALARRAKQVVAVDSTRAMLDVARRAALEEGLGNLRCLESEAERLPFRDGTFDLVVSRLAVHHFLNPRAPVSEMCRAARGGRVVVIDLVAPDDDALRARYNDVERMRDPSHTHALPQDRLLELLGEAGRTPSLLDVRDVAVDFERWVGLTKTPAAMVERIRGLLEEELEGGEETGFRPRSSDGRLVFRQRWAIVEA